MKLHGQKVDKADAFFNLDFGSRATHRQLRIWQSEIALLAAVIPMDWVVIGLVICSIVGIVFGTYPAWKAANLDPIESLRYE